MLDAWFRGGIDDPRALADALATRPGVVETGLFLGMAPEVVVGRE
ncbi:MAG: ribose-5-phosphate isomerase A [Solirubrobacteraceae bacterium]